MLNSGKMYGMENLVLGAPQQPRIQRSHGRGKIVVRACDRGTVIDDLYQHANAKIRIPRTHNTSLSAVLVNTAGGVAGGDTLRWNVRAERGADCSVTTQACERIYGHATETARIDNHIEVKESARCLWIPQETIIYEGAMLKRSLSVDLVGDASFLGLEAIVLGRAHMGESLQRFALEDRWIVRRDGAPMFADHLRMNDHDGDMMVTAAGLNGRSVFATLLFVPGHDDARIAHMGERVSTLAPLADVAIGASAFDQYFVCRFAAASSFALRQALPTVLSSIKAEIELPKIWRF